MTTDMSFAIIFENAHHTSTQLNEHLWTQV